MTTPRATVAAGPLFQRASSGLVREGGTFDTLIYNIQFITPGLAITIMLLFLPAFYPGLNLYAALLIGVAVCLPTTIVYAMLSATIPRSGADYVWVSRIIHPVLGAMTSISFTVLWLFYNQLPASWIASYGLSPLFRQIGLVQHSEALYNLGIWFGTNWGQFIVAAIAIAFYTGVFIFGLRVFFRIQNVMFAIVTGGLIITAIAIAVISFGAFQHGINSALAWKTGDPNSFATVLKSASKAGFIASAPFDFKQTLLGLSWIYLTFVFGISSAYIGSEIQRARRVQLWAIPVATLYATAWALVLFWLVSRTGALQFIGAADFVGGGPFAGSTTFSELFGYAMPLAVAIIIGITFTLWFAGPLPNQMLNTSRNILAYGLDGLVPRRLAEVNERFNSPVVNLIFVMVGSWVFLALFRFTTIFATLSAFLAYTLTFATVSLAAALLPFRRRELFETSPVRWRIFHIPVITVVGVLSIACQGIAAWVYLTDPLDGLVGNVPMIIINLVIFGGGVVVYLLAKTFWRTRGYDLDANYRELPVE